MQKLERGYKHIVQGTREKIRNLVPIQADSFEKLAQLAERERAVSLEVRSFVQTVYHAAGGIEWGTFPVATSSPPDAYLSKTRYEARGLGRRIVMDEVHDELDGKSSESTLLRAKLRCELTAEQRREMLAGLMPNVKVSIDLTLDNEEEHKRVLNRARALRLTPYEVKDTQQ